MPKPAQLTCHSVRPSRRTSASAFKGLPPDPDDPLLGFAPVPHSRPRRNSINPDLQRAFIAALAATGIVSQAARTIGKSLEALYKLRQRRGAEGFRAAWDMAIDRGIARLEDCALQRALEGEERPVVSRGEIVGTWRRHDNALLMFLLRQRRSHRYAAGVRDGGNLRPGNPLYDRLRREWEAEAFGDEQEVYDSIDRMLDTMMANTLAANEILQEEDAGEDGA
jgi:hypothetical protein